MCFSAQASFGASIVLGIMGVYALKKAIPSQRFLATVPLFFAIQQACEGIVWVTYSNPAHALLTTLATYSFCFFAFFFWPIWIPITTIKMETDPRRQTILQGILIIGSLVSSVLIFSVFQNGIQTTVSCHHIRYDLFLPTFLSNVGIVFYCIATILPLFVSSKRWLSLFGVLTIGSVALSAFFYETFFVSVWCFFAALLSSVIIWIL